MQIKLSYSLETETDHLILPILANDQLDDTLQDIANQAGIAAKQLQSAYQADLGEVQMVYTAKQSLFLLGLGTQPHFAEVLKAFRSFSNKYKSKIDKSLAVNWQYCQSADDCLRWVEASTNGLVLGTYQIGRFKSKNGELHPLAQDGAKLKKQRQSEADRWHVLK